MFGRNKQKASTSEPRRRRDLSTDAKQDSGRYTLNKTISSYVSGSNKGGETEEGRSERQRTHRVKARQKQVSAVLAVLVVSILFLGTLIYNYTTEVTVSAVSTEMDIVNTLDEKKYQDIIYKYLSTRPTSRLRFSQDLADISSFIGSSAPEVKYIKRSSFDGVGTSNFDLVFRQPILKWQVADKTYYVDDEGVAFSNNLFDEPAIELRDATVAGGLVVDGNVKISRRILEFSGRLVAALTRDNHKVEYLSLPDDTTRQIVVKLVDEPTEYVFSIDQPVASQVDAMNQVDRLFSQSGERPARVDLRVPNRAYYR